MAGVRLQQALGWGSVGSGLELLLMGDRIRRRFRLPVRSGGLRTVGARDVLIGAGLLTQRHRRPWLWARTLADAFDTGWLWGAVAAQRRGTGRRLALATASIALTLVDLLEVRRSKPVPRSPERAVSDGAFPPPMESWRGSGLSEDVGVRPHDTESDVEPDARERERRMREAQEELGLPDPDTSR